MLRQSIKLMLIHIYLRGVLRGKEKKRKEKKLNRSYDFLLFLLLLSFSFLFFFHLLYSSLFFLQNLCFDFFCFSETNGVCVLEGGEMGKKEGLESKTGFFLPLRFGLCSSEALRGTPAQDQIGEALGSLQQVPSFPENLFDIGIF